eukprot:UN00411
MTSYDLLKGFRGTLEKKQFMKNGCLEALKVRKFELIFQKHVRDSCFVR